MTGTIVAFIAGLLLGGLGGTYACWRAFSERWWNDGFDAGLVSIIDNNEDSNENEFWVRGNLYDADSEWVEVDEFDDHGEVA